MTPRQREVLRYIDRFAALAGFGPSIRDIGDALGITSTNGVNDHLKALERGGFIRRKSRLARTIQLTHSGLREVRS